LSKAGRERHTSIHNRGHKLSDAHILRHTEDVADLRKMSFFKFATFSESTLYKFSKMTLGKYPN
jgi:hypothetical protein